MRSTALILAVASLLFGASASPAADVFRCSGSNGVSYSDTPCGDNAERITIPDNRIGGRFNSNLPMLPEQQTSEPDRPRTTTPPARESPCRYIASTDLRRYIIREQVVKGMTRANVIQAFGRPPETYPVPQETWVYTTDYYGMLYELTYVYFRDDCVEKVVYRKP